ncbi:MAG: tRNA (adenosine(37)-N6)-threonylcarbamoyltransferase complex ATPase subunit type 1 TsaE [Oscillospiraceae bacterium]
MEYITNNKEETLALARRLALTLKSGDFIAFTGGLGVGKTAFCEGIAEGLCCIDKASSPTFAIVNYYRGNKPFAHFDLYRVTSEADLETAGLYDYIDEGAIVAAEWSENIKDFIYEPNIIIDIKSLEGDKRCINIKGACL